MASSVQDQVVDFYYDLFGRVFSARFQVAIADRLRRDTVVREIQTAAGAASQSLTRFFINEKLTDGQISAILQGFGSLGNVLALEQISNPNETPEAVVERLLASGSLPDAVKGTIQEVV